MPLKKLREFFDAHRIPFKAIRHVQAFTAQEIAASAHIPARQLAKTVIVKIDGTMTMAVLPASYRVDLEALKSATGAGKVELATEKEFKDLFSDCEIGAMPPFGNLYGLEVYVAESLAKDGEIAFKAGTHTDLVKISYKDFEAHVKPKLAKFSYKAS
jgi:Ala-tRNA(Pro) deacylase